MSKLKILYWGNHNERIVEYLCGQLNDVWLFKQPDFAFFQRSLKDQTDRIICFFDANSPTELQGKVTQLQDQITFGIISVLQQGIEPEDEINMLSIYLQEPVTQLQIQQAFQHLSGNIIQKRKVDEYKKRLSSQSQELSELNKIGVALSAERDLDSLLEMILTKAREITTADAGSLYLVEKNPEVEANEDDYWQDKQLRFKLAHNDSLDASYQEFVMPIEKKSMAGFTALTGRPVNIEDAYSLSKESEFQHNRSFDEKMGYRTTSVLCIPMLSHQGDMIGVLQLINRKKYWDTRLKVETFEENVVAFDSRCEDLASSLASQAAVSIENVRLYEEIQKLFEGFIVASVHAIEQRDPTTSGHSERVAELTVGLAQKIDRLENGSYKNIKFSKDDIQQIKYAGLLHDFGKIGVREHVLVKAKKLYPNQLDIVKWRFKFIKKSLELEYSKKQLKKLLEQNREQLAKEMSIKDPDFEKQVKEVDDFLQFVLEANEPRILAEDGQDKLSHIADLAYRENGSIKPYLESDEIHLLSIPRGSLSQEERVEIESHVTHTFNFLNRIPWASHLKSVPEIAYAHHEKLDGSGYPRKLSSPDIPLPSKMMTIADIYDALTASDRPYKRAVPSERALEILGYEMKEGKIDAELYKIFVDSKVFELTIDK